MSLRQLGSLLQDAGSDEGAVLLREAAKLAQRLGYEAEEDGRSGESDGGDKLTAATPNGR